MKQLDGYLVQVLVVIVRGCKPNSPDPDRHWFNLKPRGVKIPELVQARHALLKGYLIIDEVHGSWRVQPTTLGLELYRRWKAQRIALRARPILFDRATRDLHVIDQRFDRYAAG